MSPSRVVPRILLGVALVVLAVPLGAHVALHGPLAFSDSAEPIPEVMDRARGAWRMERGTLAYLGLPVLLVLGASATYAMWRESWRAVAAYVIVGLASNLTVQGFKHDVLPSADAVNPLSGHVGVASAVCLGWLAYSPRRTWGMASAAGVVMGGVSVGVILAGWHTVPQVLCTLSIVTGWVVLGSAFNGAAPDARSQRRGSLLVTGIGVAGLAVGLGAARAGSGVLAGHPLVMVALMGSMVAALTVLSVGAVLLTREVAVVCR